MIARRRVLLVTERRGTTEALVDALEAAGYAVLAGEGPERAAEADLVLVDVSEDRYWPEADLLRDRRLMLLVRDASAMQRGFALGADDCVLSSAHPDEVAARCEAILRRTREAPAERGEAAVYVDRRLWINFDSRQVWVEGRPVHLTPREYRLLRFLVRHRGRTLGHGEILETVWSREAGNDRPSEVLKQYVWRLRQKLEADPNTPETIVTDAGEGYRFVPQTA